MDITMADLTISMAGLDRDRLLSEWTWLVGESRVPILLTAAGDAFLEDVDDGSVHFLDAQAAAVDPVADTVDELRELLTKQEFVYTYLAVELVADMKRHGRSLAPRQVFSLRTPLALGGAYDFSNVEETDVEVHFTTLGQILRQVQELPPGTPVTRVQAAEE